MTTNTVNDLTKTSLWENRKSVLICSSVALYSFQYGLDFSLIGGFQAMVGFLEVFGAPDPASPAGWNLSVVVQQLISSLMTLGAFLGSLCAGPLSTYLHRPSRPHHIITIHSRYSTMAHLPREIRGSSYCPPTASGRFLPREDDR